MKNRIELYVVRFLIFLLNRMSDQTFYGFCRWLGHFLFNVIKFRQDVTLENLGFAFPGNTEDENRRIGLASYQHFVIVMLELFRMPYWPEGKLNDIMVIETPDTVQSGIYDNERGRIIFTGHLGSWEVAIAYFCQFTKTAGIIKKQKNPLTNDLIMKMRRQLNETTFYTREAREKGIEWLEQKNILGIIGDQDARDKGIFVPFLGRPASTYVGTAVYAERTRSDIYFMAPMRGDDGKYHFYLELLQEAESTVYDDDYIPRTIAMCTAKLEEYVRRYPEQYMWLHKRWKTQPGTEE